MTYSVVTICWNSSGTIQKTIDSVMKQNPLPSEYIFVDGGSTDGTLEIIQALIEKVNNESISVKVQLFNQTEKTRISGAWNIGVPAVTSDVVFLLNSDDWYEPDTAATVMGFFENLPDIDIVAASTKFHDSENGKTFIGHCKPLFLLPFMMGVMHPSCFVKRKVYDEIGYFDEEIVVSMDFDFVYRAYNRGYKFHRIKKVTTNMLTGGNANSRREEARIETRDIALEYGKCSLCPRLAYLARKFLNK